MFPSIEDSDPLIQYYGLMDQEELNAFKIIIGLWVDLENSQLTSFAKNSLQLIDFYNRLDTFQYKLYCTLNEVLGTQGTLYWFPLFENKQSNFMQFDPPMIAKTDFNLIFGGEVSRSYMEMQSGAYCVCDREKRLFIIVVDGFYLHAFLDKKYNDERLISFINNWNFTDTRLDMTTYSYLQKWREK